MGQLSVKSIRVRAYVGTDSVVENNSVDLQMNISVHYNSIIEEESDNPDDARITSYNVCYTKLLRKF